MIKSLFVFSVQDKVMEFVLFDEIMIVVERTWSNIHLNRQSCRIWNVGVINISVK